MPLGDPALQLLEHAVRDPAVVARYRGKVLEVPGSDCWWWHAAVSGRGHGRFYVGTVPTETDVASRPRGDGDDGGEVVGAGGVRDLCVIAHRFGYALVYGVSALNAMPVLGHGCDNPLVRREALVDRVEVRDLHRRPVAAGRLKLGAA